MKTVDILIATPSILRKPFFLWYVTVTYLLFLGRHNPADYPNISYIATAGEACPQGMYPGP